MEGFLDQMEAERAKEIEALKERRRAECVFLSVVITEFTYFRVVQGRKAFD